MSRGWRSGYLSRRALGHFEAGVVIELAGFVAVGIALAGHAGVRPGGGAGIGAPGAAFPPVATEGIAALIHPIEQAIMQGVAHGAWAGTPIKLCIS